MVADVTEFKAAVARDYDSVADGYAETIDTVLGVVVAPLAEVLRGIPGRVLDTCSGTGNLGRLLRDVVALDISVRQLQHNVVPRRVRGDVERLPFASDSFAAVGCAFGISHCPNPAAAVAEMARVAPLVALLTWRRPGPAYVPKDVVAQVVERHTGRPPTATRVEVERLSEQVGSAAAITDLLSGAGLAADVRVVEVPVPWPGASAFVRFRLALAPAQLAGSDVAAIAREAEQAIRQLPEDVLAFRPRLVLGLGRRTGRATVRGAAPRSSRRSRAPRLAQPRG